MIGTITNTVPVIAGSIVGLIIKTEIPEKIKIIIITGLGIFTCVLGIKMGIQMEKPVFVILSIIIGAIIGELLHIEEAVEQIGENLSDFNINIRYWSNLLFYCCIFIPGLNDSPCRTTPFSWSTPFSK
uniref:DUF554 family protein n=1 Tax=candidate division WOR-3 bacterium TaxID=2052148 RepID=A0A7V0Z3P9_UNCW3